MGDSLILRYNVSMKAKILVIWLFCYILGCFAAYVLPVLVTSYIVIGVFMILISFVFLRKPYLFGIIFGLGLFCMAIWHFDLDAARLISINSQYSGKSMVVSMRVDDLPQKALHGYKLRLKIIGDSPIAGMSITGYQSGPDTPDFGDIIKTSLKVSPYKDETKWRMISTGIIGESSISKYQFISRDTDYGVLIRGYLLAIRVTLNESISRSFPAAEAGLGSGIILGEKALVSPEMTRALQVSGTTHIIALSGYNITIILGLFILVRNKWGRWANLLIPSGLIVLFVIMTGGAPSLVRAAIMGSLPLLARFLSRESDNFISILLSATLMAVFNPFLPLFDVGFQLSFVAFIGIVYVSPLIVRSLSALGAGFSGIISETLGAQISTLPLLSYYFGMISIISPLSNVIILGILPICMALTFATAVLTMIWQPIGSMVAVPTYYLLHFVNTVISWTGSVGWASLSYKIVNPWWIIILYILMFDIWFMYKKVGPARPTN
jgi:competence protein ComEC